MKKVIGVLARFRLFNSHGIRFLPQFVCVKTVTGGALYTAYCIQLFGKLHVFDIESES